MSLDEKRRIKIKIVKSGPYLVSGSVPLSKNNIVPRGKTNEYVLKQEFPLKDEYALCRCGHSNHSPYCDGSHQNVSFDDGETASRESYAQRARHIKGPELELMDDKRCAFARFCHRENGNVWELVKSPKVPEDRGEAINAACDCPTGRLVVLDSDGNQIEPHFEPSIEILEDTARDVSGPIFVKGYIPIESSDGYTYEVRNRVALCRCGESCDKPFCDGSHVNVNYSDT